MNKRSFFKLIAGATAAAAMEVCGLLPTRRAEVLFDAASYLGEMHWINAHRSKTETWGKWWNAMFAKETFPEGMGATIRAIKSSHND